MIEYSDNVSEVTADQLGGFFDGWAQHPSPETHVQILRSSFAAVIARDSSCHKVVGFATAISDGVLAAYIPLVEVRSEYRGRGIGSQIVHRLLSRLDAFYMVDLVCDSHLLTFYERLGLTKRGCAMIRRNREAQRGRAAGAA